jgi:putative hydrolase of the HAD superfamily
MTLGENFGAPKQTTRCPIARILPLVLFFLSTGFTAHRNGSGAQQFMVDYLHFPDLETAKTVRDEYFERYHATAKALAVAEQEGAFPPLPTGVTSKTPRFDPRDLAEYWATNLDFSLLGDQPKTQLLRDLQECQLHLIAFSNGPRKYVKRVLEHLGLFELFGEERLFAVDDVLPHCKPEKEAFDKVLAAVGVSSPEECVMVEDSMKNIRQCRRLGMKTILVAGQGRLTGGALASTNGLAAEATKPGDAPIHDDPAVDVAIETVEELRQMVPSLWDATPTFPTKQSTEST